MLAKTHALILGIIAETPVNPYEITKIFDTLRVKDWFPVATSSIYATIRALNSKGYITGEAVKEGNMPEKTVYTVTESGNKALQQAILEYIAKTEYDIQGVDIAIMLLCHIDRGTAQNALEKRLDRLYKGLRGIEGQLHYMEAGGGVPAVGMLAVKHNRNVIEAEIKTMEELIEAVKADGSWNHFIARDLKKNLEG